MTLLAIEGEVSIPRSFTFDDLRALPGQHAERSLLLGGRAISAVKLAAALPPLGIKPWARFAVVAGRDGYRANIPVDAAGDCLLVYAVGDHALPLELGGPVRLIARGLGRCANVKDVAGITFAVAAAPIEHACAHELARARFGVTSVGGQS